jgi:hypothetical protein
METEIQRLQEQMRQKDREIASLREWIQQQKNEWISQVWGEMNERIRTIQSPVGEQIPGTVDADSARLQYDQARELMHEAIFEVRKGEQGPWFRRVVEEFRKVVDNYPQSSEAPESQFESRAFTGVTWETSFKPGRNTRGSLTDILTANMQPKPGRHFKNYRVLTKRNPGDFYGIAFGDGYNGNASSFFASMRWRRSEGLGSWGSVTPPGSIWYLFPARRNAWNESLA